MAEKKLSIGLEYEVEVMDRNGKLLSKQKGTSHSWLKQFIQMFMADFQYAYGADSNPPAVSITDETGTGRNMPSHYITCVDEGVLLINAPAATSEYGIKVGAGDTPNSLTTYALASPISHGTGSGQLVYSSHTIESVSNPSGMDLTFRVTRVFTNNSGASVTVKEIGIATKRKDRDQTPRTFLFVRDVLPSPSSIPDGATMTVRYTVKITVS